MLASLGLFVFEPFKVAFDELQQKLTTAMAQVTPLVYAPECSTLDQTTTPSALVG